jgi:hypothetical protein
MGSIPVIASETEGRRNSDSWKTITSLVLDGLSSPHTRRAYSQALDEFLIWFHDDPGRQFNKATVQKYRAELETKGLARSSINVRLSANPPPGPRNRRQRRDGPGAGGGHRPGQGRQTERRTPGPLANGGTGGTLPGASGLDDAQGNPRRRRAGDSPRRGTAPGRLDFEHIQGGTAPGSSSTWPANRAASGACPFRYGRVPRHSLEGCGRHIGGAVSEA